MCNANVVKKFVIEVYCQCSRPVFLINFTVRQIPVHQVRGGQDCPAIGQAVLWPLT